MTSDARSWGCGAPSPCPRGLFACSATGGREALQRPSAPTSGTFFRAFLCGPSVSFMRCYRVAVGCGLIPRRGDCRTHPFCRRRRRRLLRSVAEHTFRDAGDVLRRGGRLHLHGGEPIAARPSLDPSVSLVSPELAPRQRWEATGSPRSLQMLALGATQYVTSSVEPSASAVAPGTGNHARVFVAIGSFVLVLGLIAGATPAGAGSRRRTCRSRRSDGMSVSSRTDCRRQRAFFRG